MEVTFLKDSHDCHKALFEDLRLNFILIKGKVTLKIIKFINFRSKVYNYSRKIEFSVIVKTVKVKYEHIGQRFN
jgi:hypothetical protein